VNIADAVVAANIRNFASLKLGTRTMKLPAIAPAIPIAIIMMDGANCFTMAISYALANSGETELRNQYCEPALSLC
jgi:hypothetical protein